MRHILYLPKVAGRHKLAKVSAYLKVAANTKRPFNEQVGPQYTSLIKRGSEWMAQASSTIKASVSVNDIPKVGAQIEFDDNADIFTHVITTLGRECREWAPEATNAEIDH